MNVQATSDLQTPTRRTLLRSAAAIAAVAGAPGLVRAQSAPIKIGMSTVTTGRFAYAALGQVVATKLLFERPAASRDTSSNSSWATRAICPKRR